VRALSIATYLAFKEIWRNRGRFLLVSMVIALITLLVLFIAALGEGLATANRQYVSGIDAQLIVFLQKSDYSISSSQLQVNTVNQVRRVDGVAAAGPIYTSTTEIEAAKKPVKVSLLSAIPGQPGMPPVISGRAFRTGDSQEVVIDKNAQLQTGFQIGDVMTVRSTQGGTDEFFYLRVVGMVENQAYFFQPTIFTSPQTWEKIRPQSAADLKDDTPYPNIIAVKLSNPGQIDGMKNQLLAKVPNIEVADIPTTINNIPGYTAQQGTVQTQGVFTLLIGILVIGGFFQIQILQKVPQIGVLKAIGSTNGTVGASAVIQIILITAIGVGIGGGLTYLLSLSFPPTIPLIFNGTSSLFAIIALLLIGPVGGLVSVVYAVRIEPLKALRLQ
jgi:putative ABC transport system permease protein